jgi:uncharacterized protein YkwD
VSSPIKILIALASLACWALVTAGSASATSCPNTELQVTQLGKDALENSIACLVNEERTDRGIGPVYPNGDLRDAAARHSNEMVQERYFEHTSPAGVTFIDRIQATGYMRGARSWIAGENLVWGSGYLGTPQALVTAWMNSPPHRENLLKARFREIGIAAVVGTPEDTFDTAGVTVSSEYGYRSNGKKARKARKSRAAKARKSRVQRRRHAKK